MKNINLQDEMRRQQALKRLQLPSTMAPTSSAYKTMRDAAMIELQFSGGGRRINPNDSFHNMNESFRGQASSVDVSNRSTSELVQEVDVVRGREMVKHQTKTFGSICMVVRRPG
jgi:hypothetical protein